MTLALVTAKPSDAEFLVIFNRLCVALREPQDDSGITQGIYFDALRDLPMVALETGAGALMKEPGRRFFPTTAEWRTAAELAQKAALKSVLQPERDAAWQHDCTNCEDTGWELGEGGMPLTCPEIPCGRERAHLPHTFTRVCFCRPTNRTWMRHQNFGSGE